MNKKILIITIGIIILFIGNEFIIGKYIFSEEINAFNVSILNWESKVKNTSIINNSSVTFEIWDNDNIIVENELINFDKMEFDKEYILKIYNKSDVACSFCLNIDGTELNTFSNYVTINLNEEPTSNSSMVSMTNIKSGHRLPNLNTYIVMVEEFKPSVDPLIYKFKISTDTVKLVAEKVPSRITDFNFNLNMSFVDVITE